MDGCMRLISINCSLVGICTQVPRVGAVESRWDLVDPLIWSLLLPYFSFRSRRDSTAAVCTSQKHASICGRFSMKTGQRDMKFSMKRKRGRREVVNV
ncbi:hypothetical protein Y032_0011g1427 [Ancylostoma ceylanicum]|uniref:Uncharacterized protein n=1 Tax=Ancylostoma ceylanicum TaxID=53326 RepID=A0A016VGH5_9BILA|nr:hypothetical protein Y032_0011g1427 [Ancylostoma ceylanicum]